MRLTYIFHSGFVLETEKSILIFDYWLDLNGVVPQREPSSSLEWPSRDGTRRSQSAWRMKEFTDEKGIPFWEITKEGDTIEI